MSKYAWVHYLRVRHQHINAVSLIGAARFTIRMFRVPSFGVRVLLMVGARNNPRGVASPDSACCCEKWSIRIGMHSISLDMMISRRLGVSHCEWLDALYREAHPEMESIVISIPTLGLHIISGC